MKKKRFFLLFMLVFVIFAVGCKSKDKKVNEIEVEPTEEVTVIPTEEPTQTPTVVLEEEGHEGEVRSLLTGEWVSEETAKLRPYAFMYNNIKYANPQSGTSEASIMYEALVEGGITRMMGIFEDLYDDDGNLLKRIGSVRSARHYYVSFADEYDAIYVHYGETKYATKKIANLGIDTLSGLTGIGTTVFYRDKSISAPHNAFASGEGVLAGTEKKGYRTEYEDGYEGHFSFYTEDTDFDGDITANKVTLGFSSYTSPYFEYNEDTKLYERYQFGGPHIDYNTKEQLTFKNLIVQFVNEWNIDKNGYQTMDIENASGTGYYISNNTAVKITWTKNESTRKMRYYAENGEELTMNPGKTYIGVFPENRESELVIQ